MAYSYIQEDGTVAVCSLQSSIPTGATFAEVNQFPDKRYRNAWRLNAGAIEIDATEKVKADKELVIAERNRRVGVIADSSGKKETTLLMQALSLSHAKQGRPLTAAEKARETEFLSLTSTIDAIDAIADAAILAGTDFDSVVWE